MSGSSSGKSASDTTTITAPTLVALACRGVSAATEKMREEGLSDVAIDTFAHYEERLHRGEQGTLAEAELEPLADVPKADGLPEPDRSALERVVVLKLNGGLGTSMGMTKAKSLVEVKDGHTFLDVIARQVLHLREQHDAAIPLLLMNSFATRDDTLAALERYPELALDGLPLDFLQGKVPKLLADGFEPVSWEADPSLEWAPPGHGDVFASRASGCRSRPRSWTARRRTARAATWRAGATAVASSSARPPRSPPRTGTHS